MTVYEELRFAPMLITDVFETMKSSRAWYDKSALRPGDSSTYPYISRTKADNGVEGFCSQQVKDPEDENAITLGLDTQTLGYQAVPFYTSQNIQVLRHSQLSPASATVLMTLIAVQLRKFSWGGNGATLGRLKATRIMVPVTQDEDGNDVPDWDGMERFGKELAGKARAEAAAARLKAVAAPQVPPALRFAPMLITDVFETMKASRAWYDKVHLAAGEPVLPYLSQTWSDNGVADIVAHQGVDPEPGNCVTVTLKTQSTFYQPVPFYTAQNFLIFRHPRLNEYAGLFLVTTMRRALQKFSWGYGVSMQRLKATKVMVPVTQDEAGTQVVDWDGIEEYGRWLMVQVDCRAATPLEETA